MRAQPEVSRAERLHLVQELLGLNPNYGPHSNPTVMMPPQLSTARRSPVRRAVDYYLPPWIVYDWIADHAQPINGSESGPVRLEKRGLNKLKKRIQVSCTHKLTANITFDLTITGGKKV